MIRNKNMVFDTANDDSANVDKGVKVPIIANASLPTAAAAYEGYIAYDGDANKLVFCSGTAWETITSAE